MPQSARVEGEEKRIQKKKVQAKEEKETEAEDNKKLKSPTTFLSDGSGIRKNLIWSVGTVQSNNNGFKA